MQESFRMNPFPQSHLHLAANREFRQRRNDRPLAVKYSSFANGERENMTQGN